MQRHNVKPVLHADAFRMLLKTRTHGPVLVDDIGLPRFWAAVWILLHGSSLAISTQKKKLGHIEALYRHTEALGGNLDDALAELDLDRLGNALESFFIALRNLPEPTTTAAFRWDTAFHFVRDTCLRLEKNPAVGKKLNDIDERMRRLDIRRLRWPSVRRQVPQLFHLLPRSIP